MLDYIVTETTNFGTLLTDATILPTVVDLLSANSGRYILYQLW